MGRARGRKGRAHHEASLPLTGIRASPVVFKRPSAWQHGRLDKWHGDGSQLRPQHCNQSRTTKAIGGTQGMTKLTASIARKKITKKKYIVEKTEKHP